MHWAHGIEDTNALYMVLEIIIYLILLMYRFSTVNED